MKNKQRTRKSAQARFKVSAKGKLQHRSHNYRHLRSVKSKRNLRSLKQTKVITGTMEKKIKKMLAIA